MGLLQAIFGAKPPYGTPPFAPPHLNTGGSNVPTTPETMPVKQGAHGLSGFIDRVFDPTNPLGQFGQALFASGGGPLGNAMAYMMQSRAEQNKRHVEHVGDTIGVLDDATGQFTPTYTAPQKPEAPHYWESNDGSLHMIGADGAPVEVYHDPTPKMNFIPDGMGGGSWVAVPTMPSGTAPSAPIGKITPIDDPPPADAPPVGGTAAGLTRRNNPGALRVPGSLAFQSFATPQAGISAQQALLGRYLDRGLNSVSGIVERYAPRQSRGGDNTDAQVNNYIRYVSNRIGVNPSDTISPTMLPALAQAMREFETGRRAD